MGLNKIGFGKLLELLQPGKKSSPEKESRRTMLKKLGLSIAASGPALHLAGEAISAAPQFRKSDFKLQVIYNHKLWEIDGTAWDGFPELRHYPFKDGFQIRLEGAYYPGTKISPDFIATLKPAPLGWQILVDFHRLEIGEQMSLSDWITGDEIKKPTHKHLEVKLGRYDSIEIFDTDQIAINAQFHLKAWANETGQASFFGKSYPIKTLNLSPGTGIKATDVRHSIFTLDKVAGTFPIPQGLETIPTFTSQSTDSLFSVGGVIYQEQDSEYHNTLLASADINSFPQGNFAPFKHAGDGFPMTQTHLAFDYGPKQNFELEAELLEHPVWLNAERAAYCFYAASDRPSQSLHLAGEKGKITQIDYTLPLIGTRYPVDGAVSLPIQSATEGVLVATKNQHQVIKPQVRLQKSVQRLEQALRISVIRPDDLLQLDFEFYNCRYKNRKEQSYIELKNTKEPGYMVVWFPTQHSLERAYFRSSQLKSNKAPGENSGTNEPVQLPTRFTTAGKSRLVYILPVGFEGIPLTMSSLLNWQKFKLKVNLRAWLYAETRASKLRISKTFATRQTLALPGKKGSQSGTFSPDKVIRVSKPESLSPRTLRIASASRSKTDALQLYEPSLQKSILQQEVLPVTQLNPSTVNINALYLLGAPGRLETSLEIPGWLFISPNQLAGFNHQIRLSNDFEKEKHLQVEAPKLRMLQNGIRTSEVQLGGAPQAPFNHFVNELWHSRLGVRLNNGLIAEEMMDGYRTVRVLWSRDATTNWKTRPPVREVPFRTSLDAWDRHDLVHQTANYGIKGYQPKPVDTERLMLSTLGCWFDAHANFESPDTLSTGFSLLDWRHLATMGRDHYVRIVRAGFLFPFGHAAALIKITERKFDKATRSAANIQQMFVVVRQPELYFDQYDQQNQFNNFAFQSVRILTRMTPAIDLPNPFVSGTAQNFQINVAGKPFRFSLEATDREGGVKSFSLPLLFIEDFGDFLANRMDAILQKYNNTGSLNKIKTANFFNQEVAFAESVLPEDTSLETAKIRFKAKRYTYPGTRLNFFPQIDFAEVAIKVAEEFTGRKEQVKIELMDDRNEGTVWAKLREGESLPIDFSGGSDKSGGFLSPNLAVSGLSKLFGPISGQVSDIAELKFNPLDFFPEDFDIPGFEFPKIFGALPLGKLLRDISLGIDAFRQLKTQLLSYREAIDSVRQDILIKEAELQTAIDEAQTNVAQALNTELDQLRNELLDIVQQVDDFMTQQIPRIPNLRTYKLGNSFVAEYRWQPEMKSSIGLFDNFIKFTTQNPQEALTINNRLIKSLEVQKPPVLEIQADMTDFSIAIAGMLQVDFRKLSFRAGTNRKKDVKVELGMVPLRFIGPLSFVNGLQNVIPSDGFGGGAYLQLQGAGIKAGYDLKLPNVEIGICSITNLSLGAAVYLPFTGKPLTIGFNFCSRANPFLLKISLFGGGGFFAIQTSVAGLTKLEAAFEFAAGLSLDVGVASGGVQVTGGFYYSLEYEDDQSITTLQGYIRINGHLSILGLITLSMEFYLTLNALIIEKMIEGEKVKKVEKMYGEATLKVKVEILFFSKTVSVKVRRQLKAANADPLFSQIVTEPDWMNYCQAFA